MSEQWMPIVDYVGIYDASDFGRVRSARSTTNTFAGKILRQCVTTTGRLQVVLYKDGKPKHHLVHRLVLSAFEGKCPPDKEVHHIDGVPTNNYLTNLMYVTKSENAQYSFLAGTSSQVGERNSCAKLTEDKVLKVISLLGTMPQWKIGKLFGVNQSVISRISTGEAWACVKEEEDDNVEQ